MLLIECYPDEKVDELIHNLPEESYFCVKPKHLDGALVMQVFIDLAKVIVPAAIAAISSYMVASRSTPTTIKIKLSENKKLEIEIQGKINDRTLTDSQLFQVLVQLLNDQIKKERSSGTNEDIY